MKQEKKLSTEKLQVSDKPKKQRRRRRTKAEMEAERMLRRAASGGIDLEPVLEAKPDDVLIVDNKETEKEEAQEALFDYLEIPVGAFDAKKPGVFFKPGSADTLENHFNDLIKAGYSVKPLGFNRDRLALWFYK